MRNEREGVEVGVAFDTAGERGSFADGLADPGAGRAVTPDDPVRIASVSKLVVAIGVMKLVELGRLDLDADVSDMLGYTVKPPGRRRPPVTLRMLLSHTSGLRDHDDQYAIPLGERLEAVLRSPHSWDPAHPPASGYFTYSNLNFAVVGSVMERATGERFDRWIRRQVLDPLKIDGCFNWPTCSDAAIARAVVLTQDGKPIRDDLRSRRPDCPVFVREGQPCDLSRWVAGENGALFSPQGGLRISARGLARIGRMLLNGGTLDGARILSRASVEELLRPQWRFNGSNGATDDGFYCSYGLASQQIGIGGQGCSDDGAGDGTPRVGHAGEAYGLRSGLWIDRVQRTGVAYFVTGLAADPPRGRSAFRQSEEQAFRRSLSLLRPTRHKGEADVGERRR
ncbi:serine hydrolase domain-containing protein [Sphingomonas sp. GCM10030256]|uniref:serine hydrolase domain-containing protein n=1 Tax=Sphingomonas sp. GCM10030256 TaxID=3273427 RepID=UPI00361BEF47